MLVYVIPERKYLNESIILAVYDVSDSQPGWSLIIFKHFMGSSFNYVSNEIKNYL